MALNFLSQLFSPGPGLDGSDIGAQPGMMPSPLAAPPVAPVAPPQAPITTLPDASNMLQSLNVQPGVTPNAAPVPDQPAAAPRARRSILDTVGRLADVFAKVGGAEALYQPTLDAREDRALSLEDHSRAVDLDKLKLETAQNTLDDAGRARLAQAVRGTQAILAQNPKADVGAIFSALAQRAGVSPDQAAAFAGQLAQDPSLLDGVGSFDDNGDKYGGSVVYAKGPDGKIVAFQPNLKGGKGRAVLPDGFEAVDPLKFVNLGDKQVGVGGRSGEVVTEFQNGVNPDKAADRATRTDIARGNNRTAVTIAGMPARAKAPAAGDKKGDAAAGNSEALIALDNLDNGFKDLDRLGALPGSKGGVVNNVLGALGRTAAGQYIGEQSGDPAAQRRVAMGKTINTLQQTLIKALPASATRTKFEQEILAKSLPDPTRMSLSTAREVINDYRQIFKRAQAAAAAEARGGGGGGGGALPPRIQRSGGAPAPKPVGKPTVSNW